MFSAPCFKKCYKKFFLIFVSTLQSLISKRELISFSILSPRYTSKQFPPHGASQLSSAAQALPHPAQLSNIQIPSPAKNPQNMCSIHGWALMNQGHPIFLGHCRTCLFAVCNTSIKKKKTWGFCWVFVLFLFV